MAQPSAGGYVPATNSTYDPRTGAFTGYNGLGQAAGKGGAGTAPSRSFGRCADAAAEAGHATAAAEAGPLLLKARTPSAGTCLISHGLAPLCLPAVLAAKPTSSHSRSARPNTPLPPQRPYGASMGAAPQGYGYNPKAYGSLESQSAKAEMIRREFSRTGQDPEFARKVAAREGLNNYVGDNGSSFGPFQLHMGGLASGRNSGPGLGDVFKKKTGLDPRDPSTVPQQIKWVADYTAKHGWGDFHGARNAGGASGGMHNISGAVGDIPGASAALSPQALAAPLPLRSPATNVRQLNPGLLSTVTAGANTFMADNPGYKVQINEGFNTQGHTKFSHHHNGTAMDIQIIGPNEKQVPNEGNDPTGIHRDVHGVLNVTVTT
jgi:hypothetical protein